MMHGQKKTSNYILQCFVLFFFSEFLLSSG